MVAPTEHKPAKGRCLLCGSVWPCPMEQYRAAQEAPQGRDQEAAPEGS